MPDGNAIDLIPIADQVALGLIPPLQHNQLMSEYRVLCLKSALRLERRGEQGQEEAQQSDYRR
jgi:hypothetical protein